MDTDAETWLEEAYPQLYTRWRQAYLTHSNTSTGEGSGCGVCGSDKKAALHYGVMTCEADKQFLKRTFHERLIYKPCSMACPPRLRGWCKHCRLTRGLDTGINLKMIRIGERGGTKSRSRATSVAAEPELTSQPSAETQPEKETIRKVASGTRAGKTKSEKERSRKRMAQPRSGKSKQTCNSEASESECSPKLVTSESGSEEGGSPLNIEQDTYSKHNHQEYSAAETSSEVDNTTSTVENTAETEHSTGVVSQSNSNSVEYSETRCYDSRSLHEEYYEKKCPLNPNSIDLAVQEAVSDPYHYRWVQPHAHISPYSTETHPFENYNDPWGFEAGEKYREDERTFYFSRDISAGFGQSPMVIRPQPQYPAGSGKEAASECHWPLAATDHWSSNYQMIPYTPSCWSPPPTPSSTFSSLHHDSLVPPPLTPSPPLLMHPEDTGCFDLHQPQQTQPLDLSSSSSSSSSSSGSSQPPSRPSSSCGLLSASHHLLSPTSLRLSQEIGSSFNKLSVNSAVLQEALAHLDSNLSCASLVNLSHLSDLLPEH